MERSSRQYLPLIADIRGVIAHVQIIIAAHDLMTAVCEPIYQFVHACARYDVDQEVIDRERKNLAFDLQSMNGLSDQYICTIIRGGMRTVTVPLMYDCILTSAIAGVGIINLRFTFIDVGLTGQYEVTIYSNPITRVSSILWRE